MVLDPKKSGNRFDRASSFFFFIVALIVIVIGAALEQLQRIGPLEIGGNLLLLLLLTGLVLLIYRLRRKFS